MHTERGHYYHCYNRGNNKQDIFNEEADYLYLVGLLKKNNQRINIGMIAYCLIPNHSHLLLRQDGKTQVSRFIQSTFQSYAQRFNNKYQRTGRLYENPNPPKRIDDEDYLFQVCRYIHRNPLEAGLVKNLANWPYSNYPEFIEIRNGILYLKYLVTEWFVSPEKYRKFAEGMDKGFDNIRPYLFEKR